MQKNSFLQWLVRMIKKDMNQYEEDVGGKQEIYREVRCKSKYNRRKRGKES